MYLGDAELGLGHFDAAVEEFRKAIDNGFHTFAPYADLAAAYALARQDGRSEIRPGGSSALASPNSPSNGFNPIAPNIPEPLRRPAQGRAARRMTAARRLAAILAADVVGYSRLMGEDEAGTALSVREHREAARPIVAGLGGRIVKTTGDGLLLEFPSVVAAVECAIAIQKLMAERNAGTPEDKRIVYRIGVNLGDVLIEGDDILGDGVNIAARLEGICEPGGVLISGAAYDHVRGRIDADFVDLGEKDLKNIARPVRVYAVKTGSESAAPAPSASEPNRQGPPRLSMVVLPFANIGGDPEQEHFVDGVTESLTTDLSRIRGAVVIARNTAFTYKGKAARREDRSGAS